MNPETTGIIASIDKPLPFKSKLPKPFVCDDYSRITTALHKIKAKNIILDDVQYLMANEFMRRVKEKGWEKFNDIALNFWNLINEVKKLPDDVIVYFLGHTEEAEGRTKFKTIGKMLDEKITIEGMFTIVLKAIISDGNFFFSTQNSGSDTVKSPIDMFDSAYIPNDMAIVEKAIRDFYEIPIKAEVKNDKSII
jgi:hypothetical protein